MSQDPLVIRVFRWTSSYGPDQGSEGPNPGTIQAKQLWAI